jgi:apolipoprotein D and lipocalin family protein
MISQLMVGLLLASAVADLDYNRYAGKWHEVARLPNRFQKRCVKDVTAEYFVRRDGNIDVLNQCTVKDGTQISARGIARQAGAGRPNSMLKVRFAPWFLSFLPQVWGDYHVLILAPDYSYAAVGSPDRKYLWILARTPDLPGSIYEQLMKDLGGMGFEVERIQRSY